MSNDNHDQSVGGQGATDGLSGTENAGTEGADSGQGVNKGQRKGQRDAGGRQPGGGGKGGGPLQGAGPGQAGMTGAGNVVDDEGKESQPDSNA